MKELPIKFVELAKVFQDHGHHAYLVGGSSRDFILNHDFNDYDVTTDALADEVITYFDVACDRFKEFGSVKVNFLDQHFDITTFRKEKGYSDFRHPQKVEFTTNIKEDYYRRDFTINAIYIDLNGNIIDFGSGVSDLSNHLIRMIGNPDKRLKEDPLRILRAIRFALVLDFDIEESLEFAILRNAHLISQLKEGKIKEELAKIRKHGINVIEVRQMLKRYNVVLPFKLEK